MLQALPYITVRTQTYTDRRSISLTHIWSHTYTTVTYALTHIVHTISKLSDITEKYSALNGVVCALQIRKCNTRKKK